jgi:iron complex outermembrane receptor protein
MEKNQNTVDKWGVFIQESMQLSEKALMDLGVRLDWVRFELNEDTFKQWSFITSKKGVSYFNYTDVSETIRTDKTWKQLSPRIGVTYNVAKGLGLYGTISTGFQTPAQAELATNTDLQPQKAVNYETGVKGRFEGGHTVDLALFYTSITDEVVKLMDNTGATFFDNAGKTVHKGVEVSGKVQILREVSLGVSYTYSDFEFVDFKENEKTGFPPTIKVFSRDGNQLPLVPMHKFSASLNYNHPSGIYARLIGDTWGKYFVDTANTQTYSGFTVFKGRVGYKRNKLGLYVQVDNIFDKRYAAEVAQSYGKTSYSPGAPRTWLAGVAYEF